MLDGDAVGNIQPFDIYDKSRVDYLYRTLAMLVAWHQREGGYQNFVVNYVFESPDSLQQLLGLLRPLDPEIHVFRLRASDDTLRQRILARSDGRDEAYLHWELQRGPELQRIQDESGKDGALGTEILTDDRSIPEITEAIFRSINGVI